MSTRFMLSQSILVLGQARFALIYSMTTVLPTLLAIN